MTSAGLTTLGHEHNHHVQVEDLQCPGCGEQVVPEPPRIEAGGRGEFSHPGGTELCARVDGTVSEPVEVAW